MQHVNRLFECVVRCHDVVEKMAVTLKGAVNNSLDADTLFGYWRLLETSEAELIGLLSFCEASIQQSCFYSIYCFSSGNAVAARMQCVKRWFLLKSSLLRRRARGKLSTVISTDCSVGNYVLDFERLLGRSTKLLLQLRERELLFLDRFFSLQDDLLRFFSEENNKVPYTHKQHLITTLHSTDFLHKSPKPLLSKQGVTSGSVVEKELCAEEHPKEPNMSPNVITTTWTHLELMHMSVKSAFAANACKHELVAAHDFALVLELFVTKCLIIEEFVSTAFFLRSQKEIEGFARGTSVTKKEHINSVISSWFLVFLSKINSDILPMNALLLDSEQQQSYWISLLFVLLMWNVALCLWRQGGVKEAYKWLCAVDVVRLNTFALEIEKKEMGVASNFFLQQSDQSFVKSHTAKLGRCSEDVDNGDESTDSTFCHHRPSRLSYILRHITCLRDICAILLFCTTLHNVLYLFHIMNFALKLDRARITSCYCIAKSSDNAQSTKENVKKDFAAEISHILLLVIEHYLSFSAMKAVELNDNNMDFNSVNTAVRYVCDELISFLTSGKLSGVNDERLQSVLLSWGSRDGDDLRGFESDSGNEGSLGFMWLTSQAVLMIQAFASGFCSSVFFQSALAYHKKKFAPKEASSIVTESMEKMLWLPVSLLKMVHSGSRHILKGLGDLWKHNAIEVEELKKTLNLSDKLRTGFLLPLKPCVRNCVDTEGRVLGALWFPSLQGDGLPLLMEEFAEWTLENTCRSSEEPALRLLLIALRYSECQSFMPLHLYNNSKKGSSDNSSIEKGNSDEGNGLLEFVVSGLDKAIDILISELHNYADSTWIDVWRWQKSSSVCLSCTAELWAALRERVCLSSSSCGVFGGDVKDLTDGGDSGSRDWDDESHRSRETSILLRDRLASFQGNCDCECDVGVGNVRSQEKDDENIECGVKNTKTSANDNYSEQRDNETVDVLGSFETEYTPSLSFDFSAFFSGSAEALGATEKLVKDALNCEEMMKNFIVDDNNAYPENSTQTLSLFTPKARQLLHKQLSLAWQYEPWRLIYSSRFHGRSYATMMLCSQRVADASMDHSRLPPMILAMELVKPAGVEEALGDNGDATLVIGACFSEPLHMGFRRYYGSSETFVYQLLIPSKNALPELRTYRATGANRQFINSTVHTFAVGGGGACSLFLNETVEHGSTAACVTFGSPPLTHWNLSPPAPISCISWSSETAASVGEDVSSTSYMFDIRTIELFVIGHK